MNYLSGVQPLWQPIYFMAGFLVFMLLIGLVTLIFMLSDAIPKYLTRKSQQLDMALPVPDSDEAAVRILGESLRRAEVSEETTAQLLAAFWAATAESRRALAHLVAGVLAQGRVEDEASPLRPWLRRWLRSKGLGHASRKKAVDQTGVSG